MTQKESKPKVWKYPVYFKIKLAGGKELSMQTQLYQIGVYGIFNGNSAMQGSYTPAVLERGWKKTCADKTIEILEEGRMIHVTTEDGFFKEVRL